MESTLGWRLGGGGVESSVKGTEWRLGRGVAGEADW